MQPDSQLCAPLITDFAKLFLFFHLTNPYMLGSRHVESESHSVVSDSLRPHGLYSPCKSPGQNTGVGSLSFLQGIFPTQGSNSGLQHCRWDSLPVEPQEKLKYAGVGSLSLLQQIFQTQESNWGLLHCRQILYQLSYQGSRARYVGCLLNIMP